MDEPLFISNHVLLALAVHLVQLQRQVLFNLNYLFVYDKLHRQYYILCHYRSELDVLRLALFQMKIHFLHNFVQLAKVLLGSQLQFHLLFYFLKQAIDHRIRLGNSVFSHKVGLERSQEHFSKEFLALAAQETASCKSHLMSSIVLVTVRPKTALFFSIKPLLQGLSAEVVHILILTFSQSA